MEESFRKGMEGRGEESVSVYSIGHFKRLESGGGKVVSHEIDGGRRWRKNIILTQSCTFLYSHAHRTSKPFASALLICVVDSDGRHHILSDPAAALVER